MPIQVYGPPPTSGTRDSFAELILEKGCDTDPAMKALKESDEDRHKDICTKIREDGAYIEAGENDNLLVQRVSGNPGAVGVLGYCFLEENTRQGARHPARRRRADRGDDRRASPIPAPASSTSTSRASISNVIPGPARVPRRICAAAGAPGGYLAQRGLIPLARRRADGGARGGDLAEADRRRAN